MNAHLVEDLTRLRDELMLRAFVSEDQIKQRFGRASINPAERVLNSDLAEVVYKINSCLGQGYPRRTTVNNSLIEDSQ